MSTRLSRHQLRREGRRLSDVALPERRQLLRRRFRGLPVHLSGRIYRKELRNERRRLLRKSLPQRRLLRRLRWRLQVLLSCW